MKKYIYIGITALLIIASFLVGMFLGKSTKGDLADKIIGVYQTDSWNGEPGVLVLYEDGSCQYPSGGTATWTTDNDVVYITLESAGTIANGTIETIISKSEHEARIVENGLVLHDKFFKKVSN